MASSHNIHEEDLPDEEDLEDEEEEVELVGIERHKRQKGINYYLIKCLDTNGDVGTRWMVRVILIFNIIIAH